MQIKNSMKVLTISLMSVLRKFGISSMKIVVVLLTLKKLLVSLSILSKKWEKALTILRKILLNVSNNFKREVVEKSLSLR